MGDAHYAAAAQAWDAFRAPSPLPLDALQRAGTAGRCRSSRPRCAACSRNTRPRATGLSRTERRLLQLTAREPVALGGVFPYMHEDERAYYITDTSLAELAHSLASTSPPAPVVRA